MFTSQCSSNAKGTLVIIVALMLRVACIVGRLSWGPAVGEAGDEPGYQMRATNLVQHGVYSASREPPLEPDGKRPPGYALFLAGLQSVGGNSPVVALVANTVLGLLSLAVVAWLAGSLFGTGAAIAASLLFATDLQSCVSGAELRPESVVAFLVAGALALCLLAIRTGRPLIWLGAGIVMGLAAVTHPTFMCGVLVMVAAAALAMGRQARAVTLAVALILVGFAVPTAPWVLRNNTVLGSPTFSTFTGFQLYMWWATSVESSATGVPLEQVQSEYATRISSRLLPGAENQVADDRLMREEAAKVLRARPLTLLRLHMTGIARLLLAPGGKRISMVAPPSLCRLAVVGGFLQWVAVLSLAVLGLVSSAKGDRAWFAVAFVAFLFCVANLAGLAGYARYRVPLDPLFCTWAGAGVAAISAGRKHPSKLGP